MGRKIIGREEQSPKIAESSKKGGSARTRSCYLV